MQPFVRRLAQAAQLGSLLDLLRKELGSYEIVEHWQQGEFHHDVVLRVEPLGLLPGSVIVVATNCNGGVKEVLCFDRVPARYALWKLRCPDSNEFGGTLPRMLAREVTSHWFDPRELLAPDARSELLPEFRERQFGGGWKRKL